ncbi:MAG: OsmC family protein [Verrucomicrobiota bacterium]
MVTLNATYDGELHCTLTHGPSGSQVATDAPVDNHGRGETFSPTDLCASALIGCIATVLGIKSQNMGLELKGMRLSVEKHMSTDSPRRIVRLPVEIHIPVCPSPEQCTSLERAAHSCPVHQSLHPDIEKPITFHWGD